MNQELLLRLLQKLDEPAARYADLDRYYTGSQPLAFLSPEAKVALGNRFGRMASNIPRLAVTSLTKRLRVTGFSGVDVWDDWLRNDMDTESATAHREALLLGQSFVIVWPTATGGRRSVSSRRNRWPASVTPAPAASPRPSNAGRRIPPPRRCCTARMRLCGYGHSRRAHPSTDLTWWTPSPTRWVPSRSSGYSTATGFSTKE